MPEKAYCMICGREIPSGQLEYLCAACRAQDDIERTQDKGANLYL
jgi:Zn finger protein HypA/HybF involved in hydrogenase expression